ncbi:ABC transporter ATP-binding protein [soil metagenome]
MSEPIIKIENIGKRYEISHQSREPYATLRDALMGLPRALFGKRRTTEEFWALREIDLEIFKGERVGVIGRNGAGKSTLLKLLSRITAPTTGRITLDGRVASLLEVGTGFHLELSGRDNIFLNGAILGMTRAEVRRRFDEIVEFSGVEKFLDTPVKRYSSGMFVRLAFAVAAHLESEILIVDEVLAVGDAEFQKKCLGKMEDISKSEGRTLLFVSHNMGAIQNLCDKAVVLSQGRVAYSGAAPAAIDIYLHKHAAGDAVLRKDRDKLAAKNQIVEMFTSDDTQNPTSEYGYDTTIDVCVEVYIPDWLDSLVLSLVPLDKQRRRIFQTDIPLTAYRGDSKFIALTVKVPGGVLVPGSYSWMAFVHEPLVTLFDFHEGVCDFTILETGSIFAKYAGHEYGVVYPPAVRIERR